MRNHFANKSRLCPHKTKNNVLPLWEKNGPISIESDEFIWSSDRVQVGLSSVEEHRVRVPDPLQKFDTQRDVFSIHIGSQPFVFPNLSIITVHWINLKEILKQHQWRLQSLEGKNKIPSWTTDAGKKSSGMQVDTLL